MCDWRVAPIAVLLLGARALSAQDTAVARLRHRADSLAVEWRRANVLALIADSLERERAAGGRDTIAVGALRLVVNPSRSEELNSSHSQISYAVFCLKKKKNQARPPELFFTTQRR